MKYSKEYETALKEHTEQMRKKIESLIKELGFERAEEYCETDEELQILYNYWKFRRI